MSNILKHNRNIFDVKLDYSNYWDFHVSLDSTSYQEPQDKCLISFIDTDDNECIWFDSLFSKKEYIWKNAINNGVILNSIGYTGMDNGLILFDKDRITNKEFLNLFLNSSYNLTTQGKRLVLHKINGNNQIFSYENNLVYDNNIQVMKLNGGFYQGFFKTDENYQTLPDKLEDEWYFELTLCKKDFINNEYTLNDKHPENKGIFLYIGTRSENKWWKYYKNLNENEIIKEDNYSDEYFETEQLVNDNYIKEEKLDKEDVFGNGYLTNNIEYCSYNYSDEYFESDIKIDENIKLKTSEGYDLYQPNIVEINTDNKFITFNHTKNGLNVNDDLNHIETIFYDIKTPNIPNYFLLFNRTCNGYTTNTINSLIEEKNKEYYFIDDIYKNCLGFQITDDGKIGYKYLVKDCENNTYKIHNEYSNKQNIKNNEWYKISIKLTPYPTHMIISIYVNDKLVLYSKELPLLNLRKLNDLYSKQEGIPYNISIGGGTQGLCDTIDINYMTSPKEILPIEKTFAGTFIGFIKTFKFYTCK